MKIASDVTEVLDIEAVSTNVITFESSQHCDTFIQSFLNYLNKKPPIDHHFAHFITDNYDTIPIQQFNPIILNCGDRDLLKQKIIEEYVYKQFEHQVSTDANVNALYQKFEQSLRLFNYALGIQDTHYQIEVQDTSLNLKRFLKLFGLEFHHNLEDLSEIQKRKLLIDVSIKDKKENVLIILYPEAFLGHKDIQTFMNLLKQYELTTIVLTNHPSIIMNEHNVFLCKRNKLCHSIHEVKEDIEVLTNQKVSDEVVRMVAYAEFIGTEIETFAPYFQFINQYE
ncbi:hypothetical protein [Staphylococcus canis]|uniref:ABC transporter ATP-binding protein n=1 Tax=Staphylococcus canis TaxID=2724942 RepID=A0ABS0T7G4_9STAP|nr:hypothetical protein [Staphylococcus canis]MBI5974696.1 hypothetical protein [Staphylococcus canis]